MLLTREEMTFDFGGARLDPVRDRETLEWILNQFLYGEVTGIQVGYWLHNAPDLDAARFLARQSVEELQHVDSFLRIMEMLDLEPKPAHRVVRFLATGMMGGSFEEHCAIEMAAGEGFVLLAFYALIDTLDHEPTVRILERAVKQEERHVAFGERRTRAAVEARPALRRRLGGLNLVSIWGVGRLAKHMGKRLPRDHDVLSRLAQFLEHANACTALRMRRMGLIDRPLGEIGPLRKAAWITEAYAIKLLGGIGRLLLVPLRFLRLWPRRKRLTDTYLEDPDLRASLRDR